MSDREEKLTPKMPKCLTKVAERNVAATPMEAQSPLNPPIIDGFTPVQRKSYDFFRLAIEKWLIRPQD